MPDDSRDRTRTGGGDTGSGRDVPALKPEPGPHLDPFDDVDTEDFGSFT